MARVVVAGGSGFLGEALVARLKERGDDVAVLTRSAPRVQNARALIWDGKSQGPWSDDVASADAVVNLAGENIGKGRWTAKRKEQLVSSRLDATHALVDALRRNAAHRRVLVNASAVGIYGDRGDEALDESSQRGAGFLADLVDRWETAARDAEPLARLVILRFGVILDREGGALARMLPPFRLGLGGPIGSGRQWMSWITRDDVVRMILWAIDNEQVAGVYNATAPQPVTSREFARELGRALRRPAFMPLPGVALRIAFGEMARETLLSGQRVLPRRAEADRFSWESPDLRTGLGRALAP